jgi:serine phosphatase RsbU (regulator of sigma subunit)
VPSHIAALTQGNLAMRLHLGRRDEWRLIEEALNRMSTSLAHHETALQHKVVEITTLYEIGQEIAAQVDLKALLHLIVERARSLLEAEASLLALRHEASDTFQMQAHSGRVPEALAALQLQAGEGLGGRVIATGRPMVVHDYPAEFGDSPFLTATGNAGVRAAVAAPLKTQGRVMGVLYVYSSVPNAFTEDHRQILSALADQTAIAMEKATLYQQLSAHAAELESRVQERTAQLAEANAEITALNAQLQAENLRMGAELDVTRKLQQMLLPTATELQQIADLDIACYMEPADEVGGDYYDVLQHNGLIKIGIGDVTGHGLESGVLMVMTQAIVRALLANGETDPVRFLATLNRALYGNVQRMGTDKNLTLALLDYEAGAVRLSGQHEHMLVGRADGTVEVVDTIDLGFPVALTDEITEFIQHTTVRLQPGDGVVLYTDGITEAENLAGEQYGLGRLCSVVRRHWAAPAEVIKECVVREVYQHMGEQRMYDDITLVVVKRR